MNIPSCCTNFTEMLTAQANTLKHKAITISESLRPILHKVSQVAIFVFKSCVSVFLYWSNPTIFAMGFITGIIGDKHVAQAIQKIKDVWNTQTWSMTLFGGFSCFLSLPVTLATSSFVWAADLGAKMSLKAQQMNMLQQNV